MKFNKKTKIMIVGLGLIGGTYAKILTSKGYEVYGIDIDKKAVNFANKNKYVTKAFDKVASSNIKDCDLVIMCLFPKVFINWIKKNKNFIKDNAILTDITGIKGVIVNEVQKELGDRVEFIAAHPMAGGERGGIQNVNTKVFENANYIVTPTKKNTKDAIKLCKDLGKVLGFTRISELSPEKHDEMIAFLSQLTHILAVTLMTAVKDEKLALYTGDSFRDLTRIARLDDEMWSELFLLNRDSLIKEMAKFEVEFNKMKEYIIFNDRENMRKMMKLSTKRRDLFDKKNVENK